MTMFLASPTARPSPAFACRARRLPASRARVVATIGNATGKPGRAALLYFLAYVAVTGLSLPGAAAMTLAGGAIFGLRTGTRACVHPGAVRSCIVLVSGVS